MVNVRFYGSLKQFGTEFRLDCKTPAEVVHALTSQIPKLRQFIQQGLFTVRVGRDYLDNRYLEQGLSQHLEDKSTVHFTPTLKGSKRGGLFGVIAGAAIIAGALVLGPLGLGIIGSNAALLAGGIGASLLLGGVAQMLTKMPSMKSGKEAEKKQSTSFSNLSNMAAQGRPVPLAYGRIRVGSLIISQGIETMDIDREPTLADRGNKIGGTGGGGGNSEIPDKDRYKDKSGKIYPWVAAWES